MKQQTRSSWSLSRIHIWQVLAGLAIVATAVGLSIAPASGHNYGRNSPSYTYHNTYDVYTVANDEVTDGHCVYAGYKEWGVWKYDGAYSCNTEKVKGHNGGRYSITSSKACVTGHSISYACRTN